MYVEFHDAEVGNSLVARIKNIDYMYQAEQWAIDARKEVDPYVVECRVFSDRGDYIKTIEVS